MNRLIIAATAGATTLGAVAAAQDGRLADRHAPTDFVTTETLLDATITSAADAEHPADVDDIVVDARTGRAILAVIDTNELMGAENRRVAVPYGALTWNGADEAFVIDVSPMQLRTLPEWKSDDLSSLRDRSWRSTMRGIFGDQPEFSDDVDVMRNDEYSRLFRSGRPVTITGQVTTVDRETRSALGTPFVAVTVSDDETDGERAVLLAPAAWLQSKQAIPAEGDAVAITAVKGWDADGDPVWVAQRLHGGDDAIELRDRSGAPAWSADMLGPGTYHVLASTLNDGELVSDGRTFGNVVDVAFEAASGSAAFAIVSVGGVLGVDDTLYAVPFDALTLDAERDLHVSMPIDTLKLAPKLSEDGIADLDEPSFVQRVCAYYGVPVPSFDTERSRTWSRNAERGG